MNAAGERVTDLVGFPTQRQGDDDQVAGRALDQGRARTGPVLADNQVAFPVTRVFPIRNVRALINQPFGLHARGVQFVCEGSYARAS